MDLQLSPVHAHAINGECYAVSLSVNTATNANVRIGVGIFPNNIAKSVFIYRAVISNTDTGDADISITANSAMDSNFTSVLTPVNLQLGSANTSLCTVMGSPSGATAPTGTAGRRIAVYPVVGTNLGFECFKNGSGIYIPANTLSQAALFYVKVPTAGKYADIDIEYIEY